MFKFLPHEPKRIKTRFSSQELSGAFPVFCSALNPPLTATHIVRLVVPPIAYLFPGLHPDGFDDADSGWPRVLRRFTAEAWRRAEAGELDDAELYASDAQWSGLCDQIKNPTPDESRRRLELAALSLECAHA